MSLTERTAALDKLAITSVDPSRLLMRSTAPEALSLKALIDGAQPRAIDVAAVQPTYGAKLRRSPAPEAQTPRESTVRFDLPETVSERLTERERLEQFRDWLFFVAVGEHVTDAGALRDVLFDYPGVRFGHMSAVSTFEFGPLRGRYIGNGRAIGLIPQGLAAGQRIDALATIADSVRADAGEGFSELLVYEYAIDDLKAEGLLRRADPVAGTTLFSAAYGYHQRDIKTVADFAAFMSAIDDVVSAQTQGSQLAQSLVLGGRKIHGRSYRGIEVQHVATLYQSEREIAAKRAELERWARALESELERDINLEVRIGVLGRSAAQQAFNERFAKRLIAERQRLKFVDGSGFSLDPTFDLDSMAADLEVVRRLSSDPKAADAAGHYVRLCKLTSSDPASIKEELDDIAELLADGKIGDIGGQITEAVERMRATGADTGSRDQRLSHIYRLVDALSSANDPRNKLVSCALERNRYQAARYDGSLQGTEVGMVLFYTDLLAKIWAIKHDAADPSADVPGFVNLYNQRLEPIFYAESSALPSARLWFGHNNAGFSIAAGDGSLFMKRTSTRIYAAGSNPINPGAEVQTSRLMGAPMKWWNDYYDEVAAYEPEYQRLNEVMKWSLILGWLNDKKMGDALAFLRDIKPQRDFWFPDWARKQPQLRFTAWDTVPFFEKGFLGASTETMPILHTKGPDAFRDFSIFALLEPATFSGGVSLAPQRVFATRVKPIAELPATSRRSFFDYGTKGSSRQAVTSLDGASYRFTDRVGVRTVPADNVRRQTVGGELANNEVTRSFGASGQSQTIAFKIGKEDIGVVAKERTSANAFRVGFESRSVDLAQAAAARASVGRGPLAERLAGDPTFSGVVEAVGKDGARTYARVGRTGEWIEFAPDPLRDITIAAGWSGRAARPTSPVGVRFKPVEASTVRGTTEGLDTVVLRAGNDGGVVTRFSTADAAAVNAGRPVTIRLADTPVSGRVLEDGSIRIARSDLPVAYRAQPERLAHAITDAELAASRTASETIAARATAASNEAEIVRVAMAEGDVSSLVGAAAQRTSALRLAVEAHYSTSLNSVEKLLAAGEPRRALQEIATLERLYGTTPDLALRRGIAELRIGRPDAAANAVNTAPPGAFRQPLLAEEVGARMRVASDGLGTPPPPPTSGAVGRTGNGSPVGPPAGGREAAEWRLGMVADYRRKHPGRNDMRVVVIDKEPHVALRVADDVIDRPPLSATDAGSALLSPTGARTPVYVDEALLGRLTWSEAALPRTIQQVVEADLGKVVRLPIGDAAAYKPSQLYAQAKDVRFRRVVVEPVPASQVEAASGSRLRPASDVGNATVRTAQHSRSSCNTDQRNSRACGSDDGDDDEQTVLVVIARQP